MKNKSIKFAVFTLVILIILVVGVLLAGINDGKYAVKVNLYFFDGAEQQVVEERRDISYDETTEIIRNIVKEIRKGPKNVGIERIVPSGAKLKEITYKDEGFVVLDFNDQLLCEDTSQNVLAAYSIIKSVCCAEDITGISHVKITVDGNEIKTSDNKILDFLSYEDIEL